MGGFLAALAFVAVVLLLYACDGGTVSPSRCDQHGGVFSRSYDGARLVGVKCADGTGFHA